MIKHFPADQAFGTSASPAQMEQVSSHAWLESAPSGEGGDSFRSEHSGSVEARARPVRILVVDDDPAMRHMMVEYFEEHELSASWAASRADFIRALAGGEPSLILLEIRLGQDDGFDLLREIRSRSDVPVIVTTGHRRDEVDRIVGRELGAADSITKPVSLREVLARVRAELRRHEITRGTVKREPERGGYKFAGWQLQRRSRRLVAPSGEPVPLTKGEYTLLLAFLAAPQRALSREQLLHATRIHEDVFDRSIDVQVLRLRRKLEIDPAAPQFIRTERGVGYVFAMPVEAY